MFIDLDARNFERARREGKAKGLMAWLENTKEFEKVVYHVDLRFNADGAVNVSSVPGLTIPLGDTVRENIVISGETYDKVSCKTTPAD